MGAIRHGFGTRFPANSSRGQDQRLFHPARKVCAADGRTQSVKEVRRNLMEKNVPWLPSSEARGNGEMAVAFQIATNVGDEARRNPCRAPNKLITGNRRAPDRRTGSGNHRLGWPPKRAPLSPAAAPPGAASSKAQPGTRRAFASHSPARAMWPASSQGPKHEHAFKPPHHSARPGTGSARRADRTGCRLFLGWETAHFH